MQSTQAGGVQTHAEALPELRGVQRQQHQTDPSGVVPLQDRRLPGTVPPGNQVQRARRLFEAITTNIWSICYNRVRSKNKSTYALILAHFPCTFTEKTYMFILLI